MRDRLLDRLAATRSSPRLVTMMMDRLLFTILFSASARSVREL
jgi:hypothetical protein